MEISIGVSNLRRLAKMPAVPLRPITILVGRNSAGKSTFLRTFPLIKQSMGPRSSAPILWYGDYVDFGNFQSAVSDGDTEKKITFSFSIEKFESISLSRSRRFYRHPGLKHKVNIPKIDVSYEVGETGNSTELQAISLSVPSEGIEARIVFGDHETDSLFLGEIDFLKKLGKYYLLQISSGLFSVPVAVSKHQSEDKPGQITSPFEMAQRHLVSLLTELAPGNISRETTRDQALQILVSNSIGTAVFQEWEQSAKTKAYRTIYKNFADNPNGEKTQSVVNTWKFFRVLTILSVLENELEEFFLHATYLGPARARSERFYRRQELEVSEIAPDGQNFPMFLESLTGSQLADFSEFVRKIFGYGIVLDRTEGHVSIKLAVEDKKVNVTDTGYGVSQLLPVLAQVWWSTQFQRSGILGRGAKENSILAIEQPELHLHPAHQSLLANVFVEAISGAKSNSNRQLTLVIETHSESLINKLGELISEGKIPASDVQVVVFGAEDDIHSPSDVKIAEFDSDGVLLNWPFGFFNHS